MSASRLSVIEHFEGLLGEYVGGWNEDAAGDPLPFDVVRFDGASTTYATVGLSEHPLRGDVRQELVLGLHANVEYAHPVRALLRVGEEIVARGQPLLRGDVVQLGRTFSRVGLPWVYAHRVEGTPFEVCRLLPVHPREAKFIKRHGCDAFDERLASADPDLTDLGRSRVV